MRVSQINLTNFRNYSKASVSVDADLVLILGDNAAGKTNFLESIYFLSSLKSFRAPDQFLVRYGSDYFALSATTGQHQLEVVVQTEPTMRRQYKFNSQKTSRSFWQAYKTVMFVPNDLNLFILGPVMRRKLLDEILSQKSQEYALASVSLEHILKQKAALLEKLNQGLGNAEELDLWNEQLAEVGIKVYEYRKRLAEFFDERLSLISQKLTGFTAQIKFIFKSHVQSLTKEGFLSKLNDYRDAEIKSGKNLIGPHRDDFTLEKDGVLNIYNSSRGELRTQVLALKLIQAEYLSDDLQKPVILLDDVFSELDETRRSKLIEFLSGHQIFITSTEEHHLPKLAKEALVLKVENNDIK